MCEWEFCMYKHEKQQGNFENIDSHPDHHDVIDVSGAETDLGDVEEINFDFSKN